MTNILTLPHNELIGALKDKPLVANGREFTFDELEGYSPDHLAAHRLFKVLVPAKPGDVYFCNMRGSFITSVRAGSGALYVKGLRTSHGKIEGAGYTTAALGVTTHGVWGTLTERTEGGFNLEMKPSGSTPGKKTRAIVTPADGSEVTTQTLLLFTPQIIDCWLRRPVDSITFEQLIQQLKKECRTVTDLQRELAA